MASSASRWTVIKTELHLQNISLGQRSITGTTTLHVTPVLVPKHSTSSSTPSINIFRAHSRQSRITRVTVNGRETSYSYIDHLSGTTHRRHDGSMGPVSLGKLRGQPLVTSTSNRDLGTFHHDLSTAMKEADTGELSIDMARADKSSADRVTKVTIAFRLKDPETGVHFSGADEHRLDEHGWSCPTHLFTFRPPLASGSVLGNGDGARCCFPCVDRLDSRCPWSITISAEKNMKVFATGVLMDKDTKSSTTTNEYYYHIHERVPAHLVG